MTDCEYIKLNTSIQTASNAGKIPETEDGTIPAVIELRLPDNIFSTRKGGKKLDNVTMLTTKLRVSQTETPIVQLPRDKELSNLFKTNVSTCQLDVFPYTIIDNTEVRPTPGADMVFPAYKAHEIVYKIRLFETISPLTSTVIDTVSTTANSQDFGFPKNNIFYPVLQKAGIFEKIQNHLMNLCISDSRIHKSDMDQDDEIFLRDIADMEKMFADALENAVTYANMEDHLEVFIDLVKMVDGINDLSPEPDTTNTIVLPDYNNITACFWKYEKDEENSTSSSKLNFGFKPKVTIQSDSLTISYDSAAFKDNIPIVYSPEYVNTYSHAPQLKLDELRNQVWYQPPPKRIYKYDVVQDAETNTYAFSLPEDMNCMLMNIVANKSLKEAMSFLPWIKVDYNKLNIPRPDRFVITITRDQTITAIETRDTVRVLKAPNTTERNRLYLTLEPNQYFIRYSFKADGSLYDENHTFVDVAQRDRLDQQVEYLVNVQENPITEDFVANQVVLNTEQTETQNVISSFRSKDPTLEPGETEILNETSVEESPRRIVNNGEYQQAIYGRTGSSTYNYLFTTTSEGSWLESCPEYSRYRYYPVTTASDVIRTTTSTEVDQSGYRTFTCEWTLANTADITMNIYLLGLNDSTTQRYTTTTTTTIDTQLIEALQVETSIPHIEPNLTMDNNEFYILDGSACHVELGGQEPIKGETSQQYNYRIDTEEAVTDLQYKDDVVITRGAVEPVNFNPQAFSYRIETDIVAPGPGTAEPKNCVMYEFETQTSDPLTTRTNQKFYTRFFPQGVANMPQDVVIISSTPGEYQSQPLPTPTTTTTYSNDPTLEPGRYVHEPVVHDPESETFPSEWVPGSDPQIYRTRFHVYTGLQWQWVEGQIDPYGTLPQWIPDPAYNRYISSITLAPDRYLWRVYWEIRYHHMDTSTDLPVAVEPNFWVYKYRPVQTVTRTTKKTTQETDVITDCSTVIDSGVGNVRLNFTWSNLPMVILSPISSIVMTLQGVDATQEIQPININQPGGSSLTSTIPIVENYISLAQTLRDLHDELVIIKDTYDDAAKYQLSTTSGQERTLTLAMKYITKDGRLHQLYIPKDGVFSVQLTFALSFYLA